MILDVAFQQPAKEFAANFIENSNTLGTSFEENANSLSGEFGELHEVQTSADSNYEKLFNLPSIEAVKLVGNKTFDDLGLSECSNLEIDSIFRKIF